MIQILRPKTIWFIVFLLFGAAYSGWYIAVHRTSQGGLPASVVSADENESDDEEEEEDSNRGEDDSPSTSPSSSSKSSKTAAIKSVPIYKTVQVTKVITTLDPIFTNDQDGDELVDGLDPHPSLHEREFFSDTDDDGVANAFEKHPGEDDFAYYEEEDDANGDGILDSYESMDKR